MARGAAGRQREDRIGGNAADSAPVPEGHASRSEGETSPYESNTAVIRNTGNKKGRGNRAPGICLLPPPHTAAPGEQSSLLHL